MTDTTLRADHVWGQVQREPWDKADVTYHTFLRAAVEATVNELIRAHEARYHAPFSLTGMHASEEGGEANDRGLIPLAKEYDALRAEVARLEAEKDERGEPVAIRYRWEGEKWWKYESTNVRLAPNPRLIIEALFTHPAPAAAVDEKELREAFDYGFMWRIDGVVDPARHKRAMEAFDRWLASRRTGEAR